MHGRIRWKKGQYRVEASPDAEYVVINGHKMTSSSLHQGDEMTVGPCRMFVLRLDEERKGQPGGQPARHPDEERTRVMEGPLHSATPARSDPRAGRPPGLRPLAPRPLRPRWNARTGWPTSSSRPAPSRPRTSTSLPAHRPRPAPGRHGPMGAKGSPAAAPRFGRLRQWYRALRDERAAAPGRERILSSPLVLGLVLALGLLVLLGFGLRSIIGKTLADQRYNRAVEVMDDGDYRTAIRDFDAFLSSHPQDARAGKARVLRALANVRQYISISGGTWGTALEAAREMVEKVGKEPEYRDVRPELAELVIRIGEGLADRARRSADEKSLQEAESVVPLHAQIAGEPALSFLKRSRLPGLLDEARAAVRKSRIRAEAIAAMDLGLQKGSAAAGLQGQRRAPGPVRRPGPGSRAGPADDPGERPDPSRGQGRHDACPRRDRRTS